MQNKSRLIIIPIVHTRADLGSLGSKIPVDPECETTSIQYWQAVSEYIPGLPVDFSTLKVYQDGLPDVPKESIDLILDKAETSNYNLLRWLRQQGADIVGTEDTKLLIEEYNLRQGTLVTYSSQEEYVEARLQRANRMPVLSTMRLAYIARRIKATLPEGGTGILFIGLAHEVKKLLEPEIEITEPETLIGSSSEALRKRLLGKEKEL